MHWHWNFAENSIDDDDDLRFSWNEIVLKVYLSHFYLYEIRCAQCDNHIPKEWQNDMMFSISAKTELCYRSKRWLNPIWQIVGMTTSFVSARQMQEHQFVEKYFSFLGKYFNFAAALFLLINFDFNFNLPTPQSETIFYYFQHKIIRKANRTNTYVRTASHVNIAAKFTNIFSWQMGR